MLVRPLRRLLCAPRQQRRLVHGVDAVPWHNVQAFVCQSSGLLGSGDGDLQRAVAARGALETNGVKWAFSTAQCQCAEGCEPGDVLVFPHYLHLRPAGGLELDADGVLEAISSLEATDTALGGPGWKVGDGLDIVQSLRRNTFLFVWGENAGRMQQELLNALEADADDDGSPPAAVLECSPPFAVSTGAADSASAGVCVFSTQSRDYATWGPGVGEWFAGLDYQSLALRISGWLGLSRRMGQGPHAMNALGSAMPGCWRGRMGLEAEMAAAVYKHYSAK